MTSCVHLPFTVNVPLFISNIFRTHNNCVIFQFLLQVTNVTNCVFVYPKKIVLHVWLRPHGDSEPSLFGSIGSIFLIKQRHIELKQIKL